MGNATTRALQMCGPSQHSPWPNSHSAGVKFQPTTQPSAMHILAHRKHGHHICIYLCAPWEDTFRNQRSLEHVTTCVIQTNRTTNDRQAKDDGTQTREIRNEWNACPCCCYLSERGGSEQEQKVGGRREQRRGEGRSPPKEPPLSQLWGRSLCLPGGRAPLRRCQSVMKGRSKLGGRRRKRSWADVFARPCHNPGVGAEVA